MNRRVWLIAEREFRAYVATASFWVALLLAPALLGGALALANGSGHAPPAREASLNLSTGPNGETLAKLSPDFPLSSEGRAQLVQLLAHDGGANRAVRLDTSPQKPAADAAALTRLALVMMLWLTLTGSLGMLLQATVRERSNRALESLLAATSARDVVAGKLLGVGAVSALVLGVWLGASAAMAALAPGARGPLGELLRGLARPELLARAVVIYVLAFAFYGFTTIAVGARARDNAQAQNLSRPMFVTLLVVFFVALSATGGGAQSLAWLVYAPPFTPFMLLLQPHGLGAELLALALLAAATATAAAAALSGMRIGPAAPMFGSFRRT
jgi:ABC-type Na+ efflux pump permease subunit